MDLWRFSERLYGQPEIEALCLELQDYHGGNVLILLWCAWLEVQARSLSADQLDVATQRIAATSAPTVVPLRVLRRTLKTSPLLPDDVARQVRASMLQAELTVERYLLGQLENLPAGNAASRGSETDAAPLALYWARLEKPAAEAGLSTLRAAADRVWRSLRVQ